MMSGSPPLPRWTFPVFELCSSLLITLAMSGWTSLFGLLVLTLFVAHTITTYQANLPSQTYSLGSLLVARLFGVYAYLLFMDMEHDIREVKRVKEEGGTGVELLGELPGKLSFPRRLFWSMGHVIMNPRGIGHTNQVKGVPPLPKELLAPNARWKFVLSRLKIALWGYLLVDIAQLWIMNINPTPFHTIGENHISVVDPSQNAFQKWMNVASYSLVLGAGVSWPYALVAAVSVALGLGEPRQYPHILGSFNECYTMRIFWGESWHQLFRQLFARWGKFATKKLGFKPGTNASSYTQLYVAFFISALIHSAGDLMLWGRPGLGASAPFFLKQAIAITLEDFVIWIGRRTIGKRSWTRWLGHLWVVIWLRWSLTGLYDPMFAAGFGIQSNIPFRVMDKIWGLLFSN